MVVQWLRFCSCNAGGSTLSFHSLVREVRSHVVHSAAKKKKKKVIFVSWVVVFRTTLPGGASGKEPACQCRRHKRCGFNPWVGKIPWRRKWQSTLGFLPGESHGQRSLAGSIPQGCTARHHYEKLCFVSNKSTSIYVHSS